MCAMTRYQVLDHGIKQTQVFVVVVPICLFFVVVVRARSRLLGSRRGSHWSISLFATTCSSMTTEKI